MDDTIDNKRCTIWRVGKGNNTINGLKYNLCEGYYALNGIRVIAWLNFNSYVRTQSCIDIKLYLLFNFIIMEVNHLPLMLLTDKDTRRYDQKS